MAFGNFDFAQGTDFEQGIMRFFWKKYPTNIKNFCKPDIYDCNNDIFYETKYTRPYFDKDPAKYKDSVDCGTGLPTRQFDRYQMIINNGHSRVIFIHGMDGGMYANKIFMTELTNEFSEKRIYSPNKKTVFWKYSDLNLLNNITVDNIIGLIHNLNNKINNTKYESNTTGLDVFSNFSITSESRHEYENEWINMWK